MKLPICGNVEYSEFASAEGFELIWISACGVVTQCSLGQNYVIGLCAEYPGAPSWGRGVQTHCVVVGQYDRVKYDEKSSVS